MKQTETLELEKLSKIIPSRTNDKFFAKLPGTVKIFCVGGVIRDLLLDKQASDKDFLLVGADFNTLLKMGLLPVGKDFPVFLHPISKEEIALARTEKKSGKGYKGFQFNSSKNVTLKEDLQRRDFTINALALDENGKLFDFFSGIKDLKSKVFRHIGPEFTEDPLRLIRLARFLAFYPEFKVHISTLNLCKKIVVTGEILAISKERIWVEFSKGLSGNKPINMINFLEKIDAWKTITGCENLSGNLKKKLQLASANHFSITWKAALIFSNCDEANIHCMIPKEVKNLKRIILQSELLKKKLKKFQKNSEDYSLAILDFIEVSDLFRKPDRKLPILKLMFFEQNCCADLKIENCFELFSGIFNRILDTPVNDVVEKASKQNNSIKEEIRSFRNGIIKTFLKENN
mgnify:CR=1 FL=1